MNEDNAPPPPPQECSFLPLQEWVALSSFYEKHQADNRSVRQDQAADGEVSASNLKKKARQHRVLRTAQLAEVIVDRLLQDRDPFVPNSAGHRPMLQAADISIEHFQVGVHFANMDGYECREGSLGPGSLTAAKIIEKCSLEEIKTAIEESGSLRVEFTSADLMQRRGLAGGENLRYEYFQRLGYLFYELFVANSGQMSQQSGVEGQQVSLFNHKECGEDVKNCDEKEYKEEEVGLVNEEPGAQKGRRRYTVREACKSFKTISISNVHDTMQQYLIPTSICRLVTDLTESGIHRRGDEFETMNDVLFELKQVTDNPQIFLDGEDDAGTKELDFPEDILFGRTQETAKLLNAIHLGQLESINFLNSFILIGGEAGSGKTQLIKDLRKPLINNGWLYMHCKFDRLAKNQSLCTIASAVDVYFQRLVEAKRRLEESGDEVGMADAFNVALASIETQLSAPGILTLSKFIPSIRALFPDLISRVVEDDGAISDESDDDGPKDDSIDGNNDDSRGNSIQKEEVDCLEADTYKMRLHYCFRRLIKAITHPTSPAILVIDDIQWADSDSLELLLSLMTNPRQFQLMGDEEEEADPPCLIVVGTCRIHEVEDDGILTSFVNKLVASSAVRVASINVDGMQSKDTHAMVSRALHFPLRLTRELAGIVHLKTFGNPLFVKHFLNSLVDDGLITYSLENKRWQWDIDTVKSTSVDDNVAEILARKIRQMPENIRRALSIVSCFGMQVDRDVLLLLSTCDEFRDVINCLETVITDGLAIIEKSNNVFMFCHDIIQESVYSLMDSGHAHGLHFSIGSHLITAIQSLPASVESMFWKISCTAIDQINAATSIEITDPSSKSTFASYNLRASRCSIEKADSSSAARYARHGLRHLGTDGWSSNFQLCLQLHETACLACYMKGEPNLVKSLVQEVITNTHKFVDTIKVRYILTRTLGTSGNMEEAVDKAFYLLEQLGEKLPDDVTAANIQSALVSTKELLCSFSKEHIISGAIISDEKQLWVMKVFEMVIPFAFNVCPGYLPLFGCRMVEISHRSGLCRESAIGFLVYGYSYLSLFQDIDVGSRWATVSQLILERFNAKSSSPKVKFLLNSHVSLWTKPCQTTIHLIAESHQELMMVGDTEYAILALVAFYWQSFFWLGIILENVADDAIAAMANTHQINSMKSLLSVRKTVFKLTGNEKDPFDMPYVAMKNEEEIIAGCSSQPTAIQWVYFNRLYVAMYFQKFDEVITAIQQYNSLGNTFMRFQDVFLVFFHGLAAFHFSRSGDNDTDWLSIGKESVRQLQSWVSHSEWNFQNKLLLLEAEQHFSEGEYSLAKDKYKCGIDSARRHHFVHEEGLANDLFATFWKHCGLVNEERKCLENAVVCYKKWGALGLLREPRFSGFT